MSNVLGDLFGNIAAAIREKTGEEGTMKPIEFPEKIAAIEAGGGSGGGQMFRTFMNINGGYNTRVNVNFGFKPDILLVYAGSNFTKTSTGVMLYGTTQAAADKLGASCCNVRVATTSSAGGINVKTLGTSIDCAVSANVGNTPICGCDETGFTIGTGAFYSGYAYIIAMKLT